MTATISRRVDVTDDLWKLWITPEGPFPFTAGQYCTIGTHGLERPYSIASAPHEAGLELFLERVPPPHGRLTPLLRELRVGEAVTLRPRPKGRFRLRPEFRHHVCIATVTGIAPFVSMLRTHLHEPSGDLRFHVLHGASYADEFGYDAEFRAAAARYDFVRYMPAVSRPGDARNAGWTGATGRIHTLIEPYLGAQALPAKETCFYACGHPGMVTCVQEQWTGKGYTVEVERFWTD